MDALVVRWFDGSEIPIYIIEDVDLLSVAFGQAPDNFQYVVNQIEAGLEAVDGVKQ